MHARRLARSLPLSIILLLTASVAFCYPRAETAGGWGRGGAEEKGKKLKVLISNPAIGWSHVQFHGRLADLLTDAGHEVHILTQTSNHLIGNYTGTSKGQRVLRLPRDPGRELDFWRIKFFTNIFDGPSNMLLDGSWRDINLLLTDQCEELLARKELLAMLKAEHYDVAISEGFNTCMFGVFRLVGVRASMATFAIGFGSSFAHHFGIPTFPSWDTSFFMPALNGPVMTTWERAKNFYLWLYDQFVVRPWTLALHQSVFDRDLGDFPSLVDVMGNVSLVFVNGNEFLEVPRLGSSKVIKIGGIVDDSNATQLSPRTQWILDHSQSGVVIFSLGTLAESNEMPRRMKLAFLRAFARFPTYDFIWKYRLHPANDTGLAIPPNVHLFDWVEQKSLLQHPRMRAFITHCGMNSLNEAARAGVPTVGIPLFGDQPYNAALLGVSRTGVQLDIRQCAQEQPIVDALSKVLHHESYTQQARLVSRKLRLNPFPPAERFVRWVEFAADYSELNEFNLPFHEFTFFTYYCLDVIALTLGGLIALLVLAYQMCRGRLLSLVSGCIFATKKTVEEMKGSNKQKEQ